MIKKLISIILAISLFAGSLGFNIQKKSALLLVYASEEAVPIASVTDAQARNLQKLCKVWGFAKYTHKTFLLGLKDWDEELLALIPVVQYADEDAVNDILYDWFIELGDSGYEDFSETSINMPAVENIVYYSADMSWISELYLSETLSLELLKFCRVETIDRAKAPISFDHYSNSVFTNEKSYIDMDYNDSGYRLLALFRLWNAIEYYYPYKNILDDNWDDLMVQYILSMLEGKDMRSYELTIANLTSKLHDAHVILYHEKSNNLFPFFDSLYGSYFAPIRLQEAEGCLVVSKVAVNRCPLKTGDVILRLNGIEIEKISTDMLRYLSYPNDDKALAYLAHRVPILRQNTNISPMEIDVLRENRELKVFTSTVTGILPLSVSSFVSHQLLDENIGLINPSNINSINELHCIMESFVNTNGLIIDLRQRPSSLAFDKLSEYLFDEKLLYSIFSGPSEFVPGVFVDVFRGYTGYGSFAELLQSYRDVGIMFDDDYKNMPDTYVYKKDVVVLMNELTWSAPETAVLSLHNAPNVTVIGENSMGANGNITSLPLPGGLLINYTGLGVYTSEGDQTQRIGLSPDIYVKRTIAGIREERDELMEAAICFILGK